MIRPLRRDIILTATFVILVIPTSKLVWDSLYSIDIVQRPSNPHEITIVTMYLNIGGFRKGEGKTNFTPTTYKNWMTTWGWLTNRVVAFFDNDEDLETFRKMRSVQPTDRTVLKKVNRTEIPAFRDLDKIRTIFQNKSYPKHSPNTMVAEYSCAMNAKYDVLQMAIQGGLIHTEHMAWLDIGLFRNLLNPKLRPKDDRFTLEVPENFNSSTVGMSMVKPWNKLSNLSPWDYIKLNEVWVSGAFVLATKQIMQKFTESYKLMVNKLLDDGMASTDQQVIGAMYSPDFIKRQPVDIVAHSCKDGQFGLYFSDLSYFCIGYMCKDAAEKRLAPKKTQQVKNIIDGFNKEGK